jgi:DNA replication protein DnaC
MEGIETSTFSVDDRQKVEDFLASYGAGPDLVSRWLAALEEAKADPDPRRWQWARDVINECYRRPGVRSIDDVPDAAAWRHYCSSIVPNRLRLSRVPKDFLTMTFDQVKPRPEVKGLEKALTTCHDFADSITGRLEVGAGLTFCGDPGCGKSLLAALLCRAAIEADCSCLFVRTRGMLDSLKDWDNAVDFRGQVEGVDLLVLDDLGGEYMTEWSRAEIDAVVSERHAEGRAIIATSNIAAGQLAKLYSPRVIDRLRERGPALDIRGPSWRAK